MGILLQILQTIKIMITFTHIAESAIGHLNNIHHFTLKNCCGLLSTSSARHITVYMSPWNQNKTDHFHVLYS